MTTNQKRFFHILDERGNINMQGFVVEINQSRVTVEFFSWLDGEPNGRETLDEHEMSAWRFYDSQSEWLRAADSIKW